LLTLNVFYGVEHYMDSHGCQMSVLTQEFSRMFAQDTTVLCWCICIFLYVLKYQYNKSVQTLINRLTLLDMFMTLMTRYLSHEVRILKWTSDIMWINDCIHCWSVLTCPKSLPQVSKCPTC